MIRFNCPHCGREYELPNALARLPLLCKQCGQRITPPEPTPDPTPAPPPPPSKPVAPKPAAAKPLPATKLVAPPPKDEELPVAELDSSPEPELNHHLPAPPAKVTPIAPPPALEPISPPRASEATMLPFLADAGVFLLLLFVGMFLGELLAHKPTGQVLSDAGSAAKFPPVDLLMWAAPPVLFGLVYLLLGSRGRTVGQWLRRRASA